MMENIVWGIIIGCVSAVSLAMLLSVAKDHWQSKKEKKEDTPGVTAIFRTYCRAATDSAPFPPVAPKE